MYLSPEQKNFHEAHEQNLNSSKQNDWLKSQNKLEKVDIYAAGLVLFELCSKFKTEMQKHTAFTDLINHRRFSILFLDDFSVESEIILKMTE